MILFPRIGEKMGVSIWQSNSLIANYQSIIRYGSAKTLLPAWWISIFKHFKRRLLFSEEWKARTICHELNDWENHQTSTVCFKQAVRWELIEKSFWQCSPSKTEYKKRDIWDAETIRLALDQVPTVNCILPWTLLLRTWTNLENVHIEDENIATDNAYIYIETELARASNRRLDVRRKRHLPYLYSVNAEYQRG